MSSSTINFSLLKLLTLAKFKYKVLHHILFIATIIFVIIGIAFYQFFFTSYEKDYLAISEKTVNNQVVPTENQTGNSTVIEKLVNPEYSDEIQNLLNKFNLNVIDLKEDTDNDGISDIEEKYIYKTDPENPDTDGDGYNDKAEIDGGYDPLS